VNIRIGLSHCRPKFCDPCNHAQSPNARFRSITFENRNTIENLAIVLTMVVGDERDTASLTAQPLGQYGQLRLDPADITRDRFLRDVVVTFQPNNANMKRAHWFCANASMSLTDCSTEIKGDQPRRRSLALLAHTRL